jgi:DNA-binding HxlR family transcriptional regulator
MTDKSQLRSHCPVNFGVELFGDKWSLLIVRDLMLWGKKTHGEFLHSREGIATNILADRLAMLEREGIITKTPHPTDGRIDVFSLTKKGLALVPIIVDIMVWSADFDAKTVVSEGMRAELCGNREAMIAHITQAVAQGDPALKFDSSQHVTLNKKD